MARRRGTTRSPAGECLLCIPKAGKQVQGRHELRLSHRAARPHVGGPRVYARAAHNMALTLTTATRDGEPRRLQDLDIRKPWKLQDTSAYTKLTSCNHD